jgi:hypothetical protein
MKTKATTFALALALLAASAAAKNVDVVTLPGRSTVQLTIYNTEDLTLVKETRSLTFKRGSNQLQFSWANTLIDPTSVEVRPLEHADEIEVLDTVFPGQKPQHLVWNIESSYEGQARVEVTYFTSGLTWSMDYVAVADPAEERMRFTGHVRVRNGSGEEYEDAEIRLIVGKIHLVEKIADLARRTGVPVPAPGTPEREQMSRMVAKAAFDEAERRRDVPENAKEIVKEGLSEYFMFTVEGTETVPHGWSKRMPAVEANGTEFDIVYRMRAHHYGPRPVRFFVWRNDAEHLLGDSPLPDGQVRVFRENGRDGLSYLGEQLIRYVPIKAAIEVNLGPDDLVVYETLRTSTERLNVSFRHDHVSGWDERTKWVDTIRNYRTKPIVLELRRRWPGHVDYESEVETSLFDYRTIEVTFRIGARSRVHYPATVTTHHGSNAGQSRIHLH